tara:strand:- start:49 stop:435 length:387 start_codon:yes stop_codon:yes gene_type:complete
MAEITLTFANDVNISAQVGDTTYYAGNATNPLVNSAEFKTNSSNPIIEIGTIKSISKNSVTGVTTIVCNFTIGTEPPTTSSFIFFSKDNIANMASPLGYFARAKFVNNDNSTKCEMFAAACGLVESSK